MKGATAALVGAAFPAQNFAQQASPKALDNPNVVHQPVTFKNGTDTIRGYLARPKKDGSYRAVVVSHGNPGISEDIRNVAAQMAELGYVGLAMDWNSRAAGDTSKLDKPLEYYMTNSFNKQILSDTLASIDYLKNQSFVKSKKVGAVGFCGGGYIVLLLSGLSAELKAAVAFYAPPVFYPPRVSATDPKPNLMDVVGKIKIPIQCHFGQQDRIIPNEDVAKFEKALRAQKVNFELYSYENAGHAFYDYTRANLHNPAAAKLAYDRMRAFLKKHLG
ncbi:MAG: dienelactone hydrolase family protein [Acidobacteriota bacterium]|nr:dienelactone hydrolase family protein [Acidobacteriota bacterium]